MNYWLFKSEPNAYSIDDLKADKSTPWDGVRNYQARNLLRDDIKKGDMVIFYHSNAEPPAVAGLAKVIKEAYPDATAFDPTSKYFDPKSNPEDPRWYVVEIAHLKTFQHPIPLAELKDVKALEGMVLLQKGSRLSVQPVTEKQFKAICKMAGE